MDVLGTRSPTEESDHLANNAPLTGYEPNFVDDYNYSETTEIFLRVSSSDTRPSYLHDSEISDDTIGRALSSPLFTHKREEDAGRRQAYHSYGAEFVQQRRGDLLLTLVRQVQASEKIQVATGKMSKSGFSLNDLSDLRVYFRVTGADGSVEDYPDQFTIVLRKDLQELDSK